MEGGMSTSKLCIFEANLSTSPFAQLPNRSRPGRRDECSRSALHSHDGGRDRGAKREGKKGLAGRRELLREDEQEGGSPSPGLDGA